MTVVFPTTAAHAATGLNCHCASGNRTRRQWRRRNPRGVCVAPRLEFPPAPASYLAAPGWFTCCVFRAEDRFKSLTSGNVDEPMRAVAAASGRSLSTHVAILGIRAGGIDRPACRRPIALWASHLLWGSTQGQPGAPTAQPDFPCTERHEMIRHPRALRVWEGRRGGRGCPRSMGRGPR